uniref:Serine protease inhibitor n=1 Tax=Amblyomma americanum TaxID=6943 RepID=A0A0E9Y235_AMBAM
MALYAVKVLLLCAALAVSASAQDVVLRHARANNDFGISLFKEICFGNRDKNVFFSPASISIALGLLYAGASSKTLSELSAVLGLTDAGLVDRDVVLPAYKSLIETRSEKATLDIANTVLIQHSTEILDQYRKDLADFFHAEVRSVDFLRDGSKVAAEINSWVSAKTGGKIPKILDGPLPMNTVAFLINAVYFKGTWLTKFKASQTKPLPFYNHGRDEVKVATMSLRRSLRYAFVDELGARAVEVPYAGDRFSMIIVLPRTRTGLSTVESQLTVDTLEKITNELASRNVNLWLPKFKLETDYDLVTLLRKLGLESAFGDGADFSGISARNNLQVSDVKHKALVEVNEEGTVAAAVTSIRMRMKSSRRAQPPPPVEFRVEHPFAFIIWDRIDKRALFMGAVRKL